MYSATLTPIGAFPVNALPKTLSSVFSELKQFSQAPDGMIAAAMLAEISLATQNLIDVRRTKELVGPCSLFFAVVADSGERKSHVQKLTSVGSTRAEKEIKEKTAELGQAYKISHELWKADKRALQREIDRHTKDGGRVEDYSEMLAKILNKEPVMPREFRLTFNDSTSAAIKKGLKHPNSSIGIFSDEARSIISSGLINSPEILNKLWSGDNIEIDRISTGNVSIIEPRTTLFVMFQPGVFYDQFSKKDGAAKETGLTARCLMTHPESTQGMRLGNTTENMEKPALDEFNSKIYQFQMRQIKNVLSGNFKRRTIAFSAEAQGLWQRIADEIECGLRPFGKFREIRDFGAKLPEQMARMAALFEHFDTPDCQEISYSSLHSAYRICQWFADEHINIFGSTSAFQKTKDAQTLQSWLMRQHEIDSNYIFKKTDIQRRVTSSLRLVERLNRAIETLEFNAVVRVYKQQGTTMVQFYAPRATLPQSVLSQVLSPTRAPYRL